MWSLFKYLTSTYPLRIWPASCYDFAFYFKYWAIAWEFCWSVFSIFKIHKFRSFKTKNVSSFQPDDLYSYVKISFKKVFHWFASWNSIQGRSGYSSMGSIKSIKNLIRSEIFQSLSLKFLFFVDFIQEQCCIFRG